MKNFNRLIMMSLILSSVMFFSCSKDSIDNCLTGTVRFTNTSSNPYDLWVDGTYQFRLSGNTFRELDLTEGQHNAQVEQVSGYILYPTIKETTLSVFGCQEREWIFP